MGRCWGGWPTLTDPYSYGYGWVFVGQWVGQCQITRNSINWRVIEIIVFCLKIYDLWTHSHLWIGVSVGGWVGQCVGSCQNINNRVNRHLIEIIEFCLKIYDLWRDTHLWIGVWVGGWVGQWVGSCQIIKN